jgi:AcrR family transcriptional regulator
VARPRITEERRRQILEAAAAVIAERGICDARVADVAARIGSSPALILYYFPSKDALLIEALAYRDQQFYDNIFTVLEGVTGAVGRLELLIDACIPPSESLDRDDNEWQLWLETWSRSRHDPGLAAERARMDGLLRMTIADIVREGVVEGCFVNEAPDMFALLLSSLIDGLAIQVLLQDPQVSTDTMRELCRGLANRELAIQPVNAL